ncbi:MAG: hypothetical protein ABI472_16360 [Ginsengibacter sp.]
MFGTSKTQEPIFRYPNKHKIIKEPLYLVCNISYPVYIIHYPFIYIFTAWVIDNHKTIAEAWPVGLLLLVCAVTLAYMILKLYDIPVRKWLTKKFLPGKKVPAQS